MSMCLFLTSLGQSKNRDLSRNVFVPPVVPCQVRFSWLFFAGAVPVFLSFFIATLLCHYNNWDPVLVGLRRVYVFICRKHRIHRYALRFQGHVVGFALPK